jgi:hypothetical protein
VSYTTTRHKKAKQREVTNVAYVDPNFKTKKALKEAVAAGQRVAVYSPGPFPCKQDGTEYIEGPHYPEPHKWYAQVTVKDGMVVAVK